MKKMLSILTAAALAASSMAGLSVSASAEVSQLSDFTYKLEFTTVPTAGDTAKLTDANGNESDMTVTYLGGTWKESGGGIAPSTNSDRPAASGGAYASGCAIQFSSTKAGTALVDRKLGNNKTLIIEKDGATYKSFANTSGSSVQHTTDVSAYAFDIDANSTYIAYVTGTGDPFYGIYFEPAVTYTTVYDLPALVSGGGVQNTEASLAPSSTDEGSNAPDIVVDATSGKLGPNGDWAQINVGTVLTIPRVAKGSKITFSSFYNSTALTIDGTEYNNDNNVYTAAEDGDVVMTCTTGGYIKAVTVNGPAFLEAPTLYTTVYDLPALVSGGGIQYKEDTLAPSSTTEGSGAPDLIVDATNGKLGPNGDWAQINEGTILTLQGVAAGATITFADFYGSTALTIGGVEYNSSNKKYTAEKAGDVVMTCTAGGYIKGITVVGEAFDVHELDGYTNTWPFGKSNGAPEFALQRSAEYTYEVNGYPLVVNTDAGKLNNASRSDNWSQCNDGTTFKIPVYAGSKLTWVGYNKGETAGFKVDDVLYNSYYIAAEDGTVNLSAQGLSYLDSIKIEPVAVYDITGTISGADLNGSTITLIAANGQPYVLPITGTTFAGKVPADTYTLELASDVAYVITAPASISVGAAGDVGTVTVEAAQPQTVTGEITNAPSEAFALTFTPASGKEVKAELAAGATSYSVTLDPGTYTVSSSAGTLSPLSQESFKVVTGAVEFNLYFPQAIPTATSNEITVGKGETFTSITDALAAVKAAGLANPVITLHSGETYREQVLVDMPNVTFKTDGAEKATITWYYGIGYSYYSLASNGYYDKDRANTRHSILKVEPARWGATVLVRGNGSGFKAENIIFENSFNQYYTAEEVKDGVKPSGIQSITVDRQAQTVAAGAKVATERAAAIGFENNPTGCELYDCKFIGSQDTFYTSGSIYVRNCEIQGNTDYIFGGGNVTFDDCKLVWNGYTDGKNNGYITANKPTKGENYIFRDCIVADGSKEYNGGNLGRDWGGADASVYYFDLVNESSDLKYQWTNMGGAVAAGTANLHIYDFDPEINANYASTGSSGANVNGLVSDEDAISLFNNAITALGFTPSNPAEKVRPKLTAPEITVSEGEVFEAHEDAPKAVAFTADIAMGTASIEALTWTATDTVSGKTASKDTAAPQLTGGNVTYGLVVVLEDTSIDPANVKAELTAK